MKASHALPDDRANYYGNTVMLVDGKPEVVMVAARQMRIVTNEGATIIKPATAEPFWLRPGYYDTGPTGSGAVYVQRVARRSMKRSACERSYAAFTPFRTRGMSLGSIRRCAVGDFGKRYKTWKAADKALKPKRGVVLSRNVAVFRSPTYGPGREGRIETVVTGHRDEVWFKTIHVGSIRNGTYFSNNPGGNMDKLVIPILLQRGVLC